MASVWRVVAILSTAVAVVILWVFPLVAFPHPSTNEAIELSNLGLPVLFAGLAALVVLLIRLSPSAVATRISLGIFLLGVAADLVIGLFTFGNFQDDRFLPLLFLPVPIGAAGVVTLGVGLGLRPRRGHLMRGAALGVVAAAFACAWLLVRGARDWLLAPYGLDFMIMTLVIGAAVAILSQPSKSVRG